MRSLRFGLLLLLAGCAAPGPPLPTVAQVDLQRYAGTWHEIASFPNNFQAGCAGTTARYTAHPDGSIDVLNQCRIDDKAVQARAVAWAVDPPTNAKLKVQFFWPFRGDYWIIGLEPDYQWALVGVPSRDFLWILAREPQLDAATYDQIVARAAGLGFDTSRLRQTQQP
ncbi:MAG: lipocalin family protein [Candidatus Binatia bacterium]